MSDTYNYNELNYFWLNSFNNINENEWKHLQADKYSPFMDYRWFRALEMSKSIGMETGWTPHILKVADKGKTVAFCPLFLKTHSDGEFSYDYPWQELAQMLNIQYFPKLTGMSPFSPVPAYNFIMKSDENDGKYSSYCIDRIKSYTTQEQLSGVHFYYTQNNWGKECKSAGFVEMCHHQYIWENNNYESFDDFLSVFNKNQRKNINKEMKCLEAENLEVRYLTGNYLPDYYADIVYNFYKNHNSQYGPWSCFFLTRSFFEEIFSIFKKRILVISAFYKDISKPAAISFFILGDKKLYGRYWGSNQYIPYLHFVLCYYLPVKWCIKNNMHSFDPGLGSFHKSRRGFISSASSSYHYFTDPRMRSIFKKNIHRVNNHVKTEIQMLNMSMPVKKR